MRRISILARSTGVVLLLVLAVDAQGQERRKPAAPMLTNEDVLPPGGAHSAPEESVNRTNLSGSPLRNPYAVLESALIKMAEVRSVRTRLQTTLNGRQTELLIESMKPDRMHVITPETEVISIGRKFYVKSDGGWVVTPEPPGIGEFNAVLDFRIFLKEMRSKLAGVRITGQALGSEMIDGIETVAYEFTVTDASQTGAVQVTVGKNDGYIRRLFLLEGGFDLKFWFSNINEQISIEPPM